MRSPLDGPTCVNDFLASKGHASLHGLTGESAMLERSSEFWEKVPSLVASKVRPALSQGPTAREPVIEYLRDLEMVARQESSCREAVQVIASGRRLLGDKAEIGKGMGRSFQMAWARRA